jgi:predicted permease
MTDALRRDLRYAVRMLARSPGFTAAAIVSLALGIGANVTIFTWARGVLLDPLPGTAHPARLVKFLASDPDREFVSLSYPDYRDYRDRASKLAGFLVLRPVTASLANDGRNERVFAQLVSGNFFEVLGVRPAAGRLLMPDDDRTPLGHPVVVLSETFWRRRFGGDPSLVGRTIVLNTRAYTVIGVAQAGFYGVGTALAYDAWVPMAMQEHFEPGGNRLEARGNRWLEGWGRLRDGASREEAEAELGAISRQLAVEHGLEPGTRVPRLFPAWRAPRSGAAILGPVLLVLGAVASLVLLLACANLAGLLLARGVARRREIAIRLAVGARGRDLLRQLLVESVLLALLGGVAGLVVAAWGTNLLTAWIPPSGLPIDLRAHVDLGAVGFALALSVVTGLLFGLAPARQAVRGDVAHVLREEAGAVAGGGRARMRAVIVGGQVALCLVLLVAAGLFLRTLHVIGAFDVGFNPKGVLLASFELFTSGYEPDRGLALYRELLVRTERLPGVEGASLVRRPPLGFGGAADSTVEVDGYAAPANQPAWGYYNNVGPRYFAMIGTLVVRGRDFTPQDDAGAPRVVIVNETMARRYWPERDAVGGQLRFGADWLTVVGVAKDATYRDLGERPAPWFFLPILQWYRSDATLVVRTAGDPLALAAPVQELARGLDPNLALFNVRTLEAHIGAADVRQRVAGQVLGLFGLIGLVIACVGVYGLVAFSVAQRTREIGVRVAMGARPADVLRLVLGQGARLVSIGAGIGLAFAFVLALALRSLLFGVAPWDPVTYIAVTVFLLVVALAASFVPARRATRVDPVVALRCE